MQAIRRALSHTLRCTAISSGLAMFAAMSHAQGAPPRQISLDIKSQSMSEALNDWAQQTGLQLIFPDADTASRLAAPAVKGTFTAQAALNQLLAGTELIYEFVNERTVSVRERDSAAPEKPKLAEGIPEFQRLATAEIAWSSRDNADSRAMSQVDSVGRPDRADDALVATSLGEVIVTGSRLKGASEDGPGPVAIFDSARIEQLGASTLPDILRYLPQQPYTQTDARNFGGAQFVEMRGLGFDTTVVLINGRRTVPSAPNVGFNAFDLNTIPLAAVERVEVLSDSASAVYGADAIGGVVNVILKKDIRRPVLDIHYGAANDGAEERRLSISAGYSSDRLSSSLVLDYFDRGLLLGSARDITSNQDFRRFGGLDQRSLNANPGNVTSRTADNLPGLPSRFAAVPTGSSGVGLEPEDFLITSGQRSLESPSRYQSIVPDTERRSAAGFAEFEFTPELAVFGELLYADRKNETQIGPSELSGMLVPAANPFNPFGVPVSTNYSFAGIGPRRSYVEAELLRAAAGLRGVVRSWDWELSVLRTEEDGSSWTENAVATSRVMTALAETDPSHALNVFQDGAGGSTALLSSLVDSPFLSNYSSEGTQGTAFFRGSPFALPAGAAEIVVGGEWRKESILFDSTIVYSADRTVTAAFAELRLPLVSLDMKVPVLRELALTVAARNDHYSDFGDSLNPQYGLVWTPTSDVMLRVSYGTSFRPPSLSELFSPRRTVPGNTVVDPRRNNEVIDVTAIAGGNPNLNPVEADSLTTGVVFTPASLNGLRMSASYWRIELDQRVALFLPQLVLENEALFPSRVIREEPSVADIGAGLGGPIVSVDASRINFGRLKTDGIDLGISHTFDTKVGRFSPSITGTWVANYEAVQVPSTLPIDRVGVIDLNGTIPRWRGIATLGWMWRSLSLSATARYAPKYSDATASGILTGHVIPSQTLLDAQASITTEGLADDSSWLSGLRITLGVSNLLDEEPNFVETNTGGYDPSQADLRQRFGYLNLSKSF